MELITVFKEPAILIIIAIFLFFILFTLRNYYFAQANLKKVYLFLKNFNKKEISYRFTELDEFMTSNSFMSTNWEDFKKALIFPDKLYISSKTQNSADTTKSEIFLTVDSSYFFNEESLISSKINYKFIQIMPTLLTGLGPFFTFLKMAMAFAAIDLSFKNAENSLGGLLGNIKIAALCSVFAVGLSLLFMLIEKIAYNKLCKKYYLLIQKEFIRLFDICTSEQFLLDLVNEYKAQNSNNEKFIKTLPESLSKSLEKAVTDSAVPYLENILYSLNKLNDLIGRNGNGDIVDRLF